MNDPDDFDTLLADRFAREHTHLPAEAFVTDTIRRIRAMQQRAAMQRLGLKVAVLLAVVVASPWLIAGSTLLNTAMGSLFNWSAGLPDVWIVGAGVLVALLVILARRRHTGSH